MIDALALSRRTRTYQSVLRAARAKGVTEEGIRDCVFAFRDENPDVEELCAALREYVPSPSERAAVLCKDRPRRAEVLTEDGWRPV